MVSRQDFKHVEVASNAGLGQPAFDLERFVLSTMGDAGLQCEVIGLFVTQVDETCKRLHSGSISAEERKLMKIQMAGLKQ